MFTVTAVEPAASPMVWLLPWWIGTLPCRLGSAKFTRPSPPYWVPSSANSAWFWLIGRSWPLQKAQPLGGKLNENMRISARNGSATIVSPERAQPEIRFFHSRLLGDQVKRLCARDDNEKRGDARCRRALT